MSMPLPGMETVAEARERVMAERWEKGSVCPCCDRFAKVYPRSIYARMARELITAWLAVRDDPYQWFHLGRTVGYRGGDVVKASYWGLIEEQADVQREDGGRAGWWRFTELGAQWVQGRAAVPRHASTYNREPLSVEGEPWTIHDALGEDFDLRELMQPAPRPSEETD